MPCPRHRDRRVSGTASRLAHPAASASPAAEDTAGPSQRSLFRVVTARRGATSTAREALVTGELLHPERSKWGAKRQSLQESGPTGKTEKNETSGRWGQVQGVREGPAWGAGPAPAVGTWGPAREKSLRPEAAAPRRERRRGHRRDGPASPRPPTRQALSLRTRDLQ